MENFVIALLLSSVFALFSKYKRALTDAANITGWLLSIIITYCLGIGGFTILLMTFLVTMLAGKVSCKKRDAVVKGINQKSGRRDSIQVFANVGIGALASALFYITRNEIYFVVYASVMASSLADCMSSEFGVLAKGQPVDICTFKRITKGISGGVSVLGLLSALLGSFIIGLVFYLMKDFNLCMSLFIMIMGFIGALIDSILGSAIQVKYKCSKCDKETEKEEHCNTKTKYYRGLRYINNDVVNLLDNFSIFVLSLIILNII